MALSIEIQTSHSGLQVPWVAIPGVQIQTPGYGHSVPLGQMLFELSKGIRLKPAGLALPRSLYSATKAAQQRRPTRTGSSHLNLFGELNAEPKHRLSVGVGLSLGVNAKNGFRSRATEHQP
jgi:hypothetical protein